MIRNLAVICGLLFWGANVSGQVVDPDSTYIKGRNIEYFDSTSVPSNKALGGNIFFGRSFISGLSAKHHYAICTDH